MTNTCHWLVSYRSVMWLVTDWSIYCYIVPDWSVTVHMIVRNLWLVSSGHAIMTCHWLIRNESCDYVLSLIGQ